MKTSPTARSMKYLREHGFLVANVEKWNKFAGVRQDVWGFGDLLICREGWGTALVQVTSTPNLSAREKKARDLPALWTWLRTGNRFLLQGWSKKGPRGVRKKWTLTEIEITSHSNRLMTLKEWERTNWEIWKKVNRVVKSGRGTDSEQQ